MSDEFKDLDFDSIAPKEVPGVRYRGRKFVLREASAGVAAKFRDAQMRAYQYADGKVVGLRGGAEAAIILVAGCLFEVPGDRPVAEDELAKWAGPVVDKLYDAAKRLSPFLENEMTDDDLEEQIKRLIKLRETRHRERAGKADPPGKD